MAGRAGKRPQAPAAAPGRRVTEHHVIASGGFSAGIRALGAELTSLRDDRGAEWLWQAGPEWRRHAPVLFPIVGRLAGDRLRHAGREHRLTQHGFARDRRFAWVRREADRCRLRLTDDAASRDAFPFGFVLELDYALAGPRLTVTAILSNPGAEPLPCALGAHPAFRWPLPHGPGERPAEKAAHRLVLERAEAGPLRRLRDGLLRPEPEPPPFAERVWPLSPDLFAGDALILPRLASRAIRFEAPGRGLTLSWEGYRDLGLWSKPEGADFLCIEPWYGMASPEGWQGDFVDKPGLMLLAPGESRRLAWSVALD